MTKARWDSFLARYAPGALFQTWDWGEVEKQSGHSVWRKEWYGKSGITAIAQVTLVRAKRGTFLHVRHGPVFRDSSVLPQILGDLADLARTEHAWFIRISPQLANTAEHRAFMRRHGLRPAPIHAMDAEVCWVLDLDSAEDALLSGMRKTTRYEIRRAQKMGVLVSKGKDIREFFALYDATARRQNFVPHRGIREEFELMHPDLLLASHEGNVLSAALIVHAGDQAIYHHGASLPSRVPASYLLQWEAIVGAKKRGMKVYNFWGIAPDNNEKHPWWGLTVFKTGFGGRRVEYIHAQDYPVSPLYVIPKAIETVRKRIKGY